MKLNTDHNRIIKIIKYNIVLIQMKDVLLLLFKWKYKTLNYDVQPSLCIWFHVPFNTSIVIMRMVLTCVLVSDGIITTFQFP